MHLPRVLKTMLALAVCLDLTSTPPGGAAIPETTIPGKEARMTALAKGSFEVKLTPFPEPGPAGGWAPGRMAIEKRFQGDLDATSRGEMLTAMTEVKGSAGYTAIEKVEGTLHGRRGTFLLQHSAVMSHGEPGDWIIQVIPDSGTGELKGLAGRMTITLTGGQHAYTLAYTMPQAP